MDSLNYRSDSPATLIPAVFTPFTAEQELALGVVEKQAAAVAELGFPAVYVAGSGGEGASLSMSERLALVRRWCEAADGQFDVIAHVGHTCLDEARSLAAAAQAAGARAISAVPPFYFKTVDTGTIVDFCAQVAQGAPELPFIYYHIPSVTAVNVPAAEVMSAARDRIPTFAGIKYADSDLGPLRQCLQVADPECDVYFGSANVLLGAIQAGVRVAIGSAYNVCATLFETVIERLATGDASGAASAQEFARTVISTMSRYGGQLQASKALMKVVGPDCGPCRLPLRSLDGDGLGLLRAALADIGFSPGESAGSRS